jgi:hypothetical protein
MARVQRGEFVTDAAAAEGCNRLTLYRALRRHKIPLTRASRAQSVIDRQRDAAQKHWSDADRRAEQAAVMRRVKAELAAERAQRRKAKELVKAAGLPLLRTLVDRADALLGQGLRDDAAMDLLKRKGEHAA